MQAQCPSTFLPQDSWIVDTGVSHHMTADVNSLQKVTPYQGTNKITIGNGEGLPIQHIGFAKLNTLPTSLILRTILHVPTIVVNLMSVQQLCKDNLCWFICDDHEFFVQDKVTKTVLYHERSNGG